MLRFARTTLVCVTALVLAAWLAQVLALASPPRASASATLVISQLYGGGGNSGAAYLNDFIELFNRGATTVSVGGWSVQYASPSGSSWQATALPAFAIPPGGYLLVREASGGATGVALPAPDVTGTINLGATSGKVVLASITATLAVSDPLGVPGVVDFVGYGSATAWSGSGPAPAPSAAGSLVRLAAGCTNSGDNASDFFVTSPPVPRNSASAWVDCGAVPPAPLTSPVLIVAAYPGGYMPDAATQGDEAIELMNVSGLTVEIGGWSLGNSTAMARFPPGATLAAGQRAWVARRAADFRAVFGFAAQFETLDSDPAVPDLLGGPLSFGDAGDAVLLRDADGAVRDALVYGAGPTVITGWIGSAVMPYAVAGASVPNPVMARKLDELTGHPLSDTHRERDWSASATCAVTLYGPVRDCDLAGKRPVLPGWRTGILVPGNAPLDDWVTFKLTESAQLSVLVGPDHLYEQYAAALAAAQHEILIEGYTLQSPSLVGALAARASAGVSVTIVLESDPCCDPTERQKNLWAAAQLSVTAGVRVWFIGGAHGRYANQHAKFTLIDPGYPERRVLIGTENLNCSSMPPDPKGDGTAGNRGYYFSTDAPSVVAYFERLFRIDLNPPLPDLAQYGTPPYVWDGLTAPGACGNGTDYTTITTQPLSLSGIFPFEVVQCPDNCLRYEDSLIGMVRRAGTGDVLLVEQAYERTHWGSLSGDPNPRLEAYIEAARRGATVRILLDALYDTPSSSTSNSATVAYIGTFSPALNIAARLVDVSGGSGPAGDGIHAKIVLLNAPARGTAWSHVGSINGSAGASKLNRETALQVQSAPVFCYLYEVFRADWLFSGGGDLDVAGLRGNCLPRGLTPRLYLPVVGR
ncbi:MAG: lamin tail domain-containing protein [Chloroflexi bacterium]|nr:lamin tail domain-containing protein [Chloroflexota bacterium]